MGKAYSRSLYIVSLIAVVAVYICKAECIPKKPEYKEECDKELVAFKCDQHREHCDWVREESAETDDESEFESAIAEIAAPAEMDIGKSVGKVDEMNHMSGEGEDAKCKQWVGPKASKVSQGTSGVVYKIRDTAIKGYTAKGQCFYAKQEFEIQQRIFNLFDDFSYEWQLPTRHYWIYDWLQHISFITSYLKIAKPGVFCERSAGEYSFGHDKDAIKVQCFYTMTMLHGITDKMWEQIAPDSYSAIEAAKQHVTAHLLFAYTNVKEMGGGEEGPYHPDRGYSFTTGDYEKGKPLDLLKKDFHLGLSARGALSLFGFANGLISVALRAKSMDVEFTLGYYTGIWKVNMMDFGEVIVYNIENEFDPQKEMKMSCGHEQAAKFTNEYYQYGWDFAGNAYFFHWCGSQTAKIHKKDVIKKADEVLRDENPVKKSHLQLCIKHLKKRKLLLSAAHVMYRNEYNYENGNELTHNYYTNYYEWAWTIMSATVIFCAILICICIAGVICCVVGYILRILKNTSVKYRENYEIVDRQNSEI